MIEYYFRGLLNHLPIEKHSVVLLQMDDHSALPLLFAHS